VAARIKRSAWAAGFPLAAATEYLMKLVGLFGHLEPHVVIMKENCMKSLNKVVLASLMILALAACSQRSQEQTQSQPAEPPPQPAAQPAAQPQPSPPAQREQRTASRPATRKPAAPVQSSTRAPSQAPSSLAASEPVAAPAAPPRPMTAVVAAGTPIEVRLSQALSSGENKAGDKFEGTLAQDLEIDGRIVAPKGSVVVGKVAEVEESGRVSGRARMSLALTEIHAGQSTYPVRTNTLSFEAESTKGRDAKTVGATTGVGAIIGAIAGGKKGAAIGAVVGAGAGGGTVLATKGKEVKLEPEQRLSFKLENDVEMRIR
jgi:hypothetical protein